MTWVVIMDFGGYIFVEFDRSDPANWEKADPRLSCFEIYEGDAGEIAGPHHLSFGIVDKMNDYCQTSVSAIPDLLLRVFGYFLKSITNEKINSSELVNLKNCTTDSNTIRRSELWEKIAKKYNKHVRFYVSKKVPNAENYVEFAREYGYNVVVGEF
jgi:hypothetical protein